MQQLQLRQSELGDPGGNRRGIAGRITYVRAAVDVMGGDHAPQMILQGCWDAAPLLDHNDTIYLVGDEQVCQSALKAADLPAEKRPLFKVVASTEVITMD